MGGWRLNNPSFSRIFFNLTRPLTGAADALKGNAEMIRGGGEALKSEGEALKGGGVAWKAYWMALEGDQEALNDSGSSLTCDRVVLKGMDRCLRVIRRR